MANLAALAHTTAGTIEKLENGEMAFTFEWQYRLAEPLECHASEFLPDSIPITTREKTVVDLFRGLAEPEQRRFQRVLDALAKPDDDDLAETNE